VSVSAALSASLDVLYAQFGKAASYLADPDATAVDCTVRLKFKGQDRDGASAIILVRVSEVAAKPPYAAVFTVGGVDWSVIEVAPDTEGTSDRQWALLCTSEPRANWRK
jgi:hypothetical protein